MAETVRELRGKLPIGRIELTNDLIGVEKDFVRREERLYYLCGR